MNNFSVIGNPIKHSKSPRIHKLFSEEIGIPYNYGRILAPVDKFECILLDFFNTGGLGVNVTLPFKERALSICNQLTERSALVRVVNTIKKQNNGELLGDNTDGLGLLSDLKYLNLLSFNDPILLVGAGGAARGVIYPLLINGYKIVITNRNILRAHNLVKLYKHLGDIIALPLECLNSYNYSLVINATSSGIEDKIPILPKSIINPSVCCYDMYYKVGDTPFISWCRQQGAQRCADGLGMLVNQAAYSCLLWHGVLPPISKVLKIIRLEINNIEYKNTL